MAKLCRRLWPVMGWLVALSLVAAALLAICAAVEPIPGGALQEADGSSRRLQSGRNHLAVFFSEGCSSSSAVFTFTANLVRAHGITVVEPPWQEFFINKMIRDPYYCVEQTAQGEVKRRWSKDPIQRMQQALSVIQGHCSSKKFSGPTIFLVKGKGIEERTEKRLLQWARPEFVRFSAFYRKNTLDKYVCHIRDCYRPDLGHPVDEFGHPRDECKKGTKKFSDKVFKAYINPKVFELATGRSFARVRAKLEPEYGHIPLVTSEDIFAFEYSQDPEEFRKSVDAWTRHLQGLGITPNQTIIAQRLQKLRAKHSHHLHSHTEVIYNWQEIRRKVFAAGERISWMWRD